MVSKRRPRLEALRTRTRDADYRIHIGWIGIEKWIRDTVNEPGLDLSPDFQRGHVWSEAQQRAYVEFVLTGGRGSDEIRFNGADWMRGEMVEPVVIVDGLQRLTAVRRFVGDELVACGHRLSEYEDRLDLIRYRFSVLINDLPSRAQVLKWYLEMNHGGTPHSVNEMERVQVLLREELAGGRR